MICNGISVFCRCVVNPIGATLPDWKGLMDTRTLILINVMLYMLYAGVTLTNARIFGGSRGARWFAGANTSRAGAMLLALMLDWPRAPLRVVEALMGLLAVAGLMMLHWSFVELLERGPLLRRVQLGLAGAMVAAAVYVLIWPPDAPVLVGVMCLVLAVQSLVTASVVFRFSGEDVGLAGWMTGGALSLYAATLLMRAVVTLEYKTPQYAELAGQVNRIWMVACLLANGVIAFGYMFLSAAKLRLELLWRAQVDELTGLLNRWALKRATMREIQRCNRAKGALALVMMDLDGLKEVNDTSGHGCGDVVLQAVGGVLQETVRAQDSVARMGGDEFCVLLPDTELSEALSVAERLRTEVEELVIRYRGETVRVRASLGVASSEHCGLTWQDLMDYSDGALYRAKREGKNRVVVAGSTERIGLRRRQG
jgi:diguanylate cyclase (GGDEF)-like protein